MTEKDYIKVHELGMIFKFTHILMKVGNRSEENYKVCVKVMKELDKLEKKHTPSFITVKNKKRKIK